MDLQELRTAARLIDRLAKRALFAEKQMVALEGQCAEWRRIADELKAARNLTTATAESVIKERDALREDLRREEESHEETAQLLKTVDQKVRLLTQERDALRAQLDTERERHKQTASILAQSAPKTVDVPRAHPVKVGEYVKNDNGDVCQVHEVYADAEYLLNTGWTLEFENCTPCDPPASHDTPAGKLTAQAAVTPQPGDMVRLVREPTHTDIPAMLPWSKAFGMPGDTATVVIMAIPDKLPNGTIPVRTSMGRAFFWPLSCVEVVKGGDK